MTSKALLEDAIWTLIFLSVTGVAKLHTFISSCKITTLGNPQTRKDDEVDKNTGSIIARKCPTILNHWTQSQQKIDGTNKKREAVRARDGEAISNRMLSVPPVRLCAGQMRCRCLLSPLQIEQLQIYKK